MPWPAPCLLHSAAWWPLIMFSFSTLDHGSAPQPFCPWILRTGVCQYSSPGDLLDSRIRSDLSLQVDFYCLSCQGSSFTQCLPASKTQSIKNSSGFQSHFLSYLQSSYTAKHAMLSIRLVFFWLSWMLYSRKSILSIIIWSQTITETPHFNPFSYPSLYNNIHNFLTSKMQEILDFMIRGDAVHKLRRSLSHICRSSFI